MLRNIVGITTVNILKCTYSIVDLEYIITEKLGTRLNNNHKTCKIV